MLGVLNFFVVGTFAVLVVYVVDVLDLSESAFGLFLTAGALGGVAAGFLAPRVGKLIGTFPGALSALAASGAACTVLGLTRQTALAACAFLVLNFGTVVYQVLTVSFRQQAAPPELLGRINGAYRLLGLGPAPVGAAVAGVLAQQLGINGPFLVSGVALLVLVAVVTGPLLRMSAGRVPAP
jgi:MFS family permease